MRDEGGPLPRLAQWRLEKRRARIEGEFSQTDPHFAGRVAAILEAHLKIEHHGGASLGEFAQPTADGFGYLFELAAQSHSADSATRDVFHKIGSQIGTAIIAFDSAADWHFDRLKGRANPLADEAEIERALDESFLQLARATWLCEQRFGEASLTASVLSSVLDRVSAYEPARPAKWRSLPSRLKDRFRRWGLTREPGYVYARFECCEILACCEAAGEAGTCCEGAGGAAECCGGAGAGADAGCCGMEACVCCYSDRCCDSERNRSRMAEVVGETGITRSSLKPEGIVKIGARRFRARAESGTIPANCPVFVLEAEGNVLVVRELDTTT